MVDSYLYTKFGVNLLDVFGEKSVLRTDGWTTDACATALALMTMSSRAKKSKIFKKQ